MHALRDFWARSLLNKLILLVIAPLLCCCVYVAIARPGSGQTVVVAPTAVPAPTASPAPTDPPVPTPTATGLGVRPDELRALFAGLGFRFEEAPATDRGPRLIGQGPQGTSIELIGPPGGLVEVTILAGLPANDDDAARAIGGYIGTAVNVIAPEHQQEIGNWVVGQLEATAAGEDVTGRTLDTGAVQSALTTIPASDGIALTYTLRIR